MLLLVFKNVDFLLPVKPNLVRKLKYALIFIKTDTVNNQIMLILTTY